MIGHSMGGIVIAKVGRLAAYYGQAYRVTRRCAWQGIEESLSLFWVPPLAVYSSARRSEEPIWRR